MKAKRAVLTGLLIASLAFLAQGRALAWGNTWMGALIEQQVTMAQGKLGILRYNGAFRLDNAGHDSDIYYGSTDAPVPDNTFTVGPEVRFFLPVNKKIVFDVYESPRYVFFFDTERERALNNFFGGQTHFVFEKFFMQAGMELVDAKERLSTELNINVRLKEKSLAGLVLWQVSHDTSLILQYKRSTFSYENLTSGVDNIRENLNRTESFFNFIASLQHHSKTRFYLDGECGSISFSEAASLLRNTRSYGVYGGIEFLQTAEGARVTSGIHGRINLGYRYFNIYDPQTKDYSGLTGNTSVSVGFLRLTAFRLFFSRSPQFSAYSGRTFFLQTIFGVGLARALSKRCSLYYDFFYDRNNYPATDITGGGGMEGPADRYTTHSVRLNLRPRRDLEVTFFTNLGKRHSRLGARPVSEHNFFGFSLIYGSLSGRFSLPIAPSF